MIQSFVLAGIGGILIGIAATFLLLLNGRIAGLSGILRGLFSQNQEKEEVLWRLLFLAGVIAGAAIIYMFTGDTPKARPDFPIPLLAVAGVLVGFGTSLGSGCTSGHGVCGLGLLSGRSLIAVLTFLIVAIITTFTIRHILGISG